MRSIFLCTTRIAPLLAALATVSCDSPTTPLDAQEGSTQAMLAQILDKLEGLEDRFDSLSAAVSASGSQPVTLSGLPAEQLDSLMEIASWLGRQASSGGGQLEACVEGKLALDFGLELASEAEGKGNASLGAWAGTGAFVGGEVKATGAFGGSIKLEGGGGVEYCVPLGEQDTVPSTRPASAGPMRAPQFDQLRTALTGFTGKFNLSETSLAASLNGLGAAASSPGSLQLNSIGAQLPLPTALAAIANDPVAAARGRIQGLMTNAQGALCTGSGWGTNVSTIISQACGIINSGGMANFAVMADIANTYPAVETAIGTVCTRVNSIGLQRLIIPSWDVTFPLGIGTVNVFPGYNQRLFPSYTGVACP